MPLPRPRFTVRRLMVAVAVVAVVLGLAKRSRDFVQIARYHDRLIFRSQSFLPHGHTGLPVGFLYHPYMAQKYYHAARYPYLPVSPDPPEPK